MSFASISLPIPDDESDRNRWTFSHASSHLITSQAVVSKVGGTIVQYMLDPYNPADVAGWDLRHQQAHNDINSALNLPGIDFSSIDRTTDRGRIEWAALHFREHLQWQQTLGV